MKRSINDALNHLTSIATKKGYILFDDILDCADSFSLSMVEIDDLSSQLTKNGTIIYEKAPLTVEDNHKNTTDNYYDFAHNDYSIIYKKICDKDPSLKEFVHKVSDIIPPQHGEIDKLKMQADVGNEYAKNRLIEMHLRLALKLGLAYANRFDNDIVDTIGNACIGLIISVDKYQVDNNNSFSGYSSLWMSQVIQRNMNMPKSTVYYPVHVKEKLIKIFDKFKKDSCLKCVDRYNCNCLLDDAQNEFICTREFAYEMVNGVFGFDDEYSCSQDFDAFEGSESVLQIAQNHFLTEFIDKLLMNLPSRSQTVIRYRYGIDGESKTLEEIGQILGLTRERVRQIENKSLNKLQSYLLSVGFKEFDELVVNYK